MISRTKMLAEYGITPEEFDLMVVAQGDRCPVCTRRFTPRTVVACIDHDHESGLVRGILCRSCNYTLGEHHDNRDWFQRAAQYLTYPPGPQAIGTHHTPGSAGARTRQ